MDDDLKFTCEECGKVFDPDPDTMLEIQWVEIQWDAKIVPDWEASIMEDKGQVITRELIEESSDEDLEKIGITPELKKKMLNGETVSAGAMCICIECQDRLAEEQTEQPE